MRSDRQGTFFRRRPRRRGAAVVEMAVVLPVLLLMLLATIDLAQVVFAYGAVAEACRAGARHAIVHGSMSKAPVGPSPNDPNLEKVVRANAPALNPARLSVTSQWPRGDNRANSPVTVTVVYQCPLVVGPLVGLKSVTVQSSSTMTVTH